MKTTRSGQKEPVSIVMDSVVFRSIQCDSCFPLTFIYITKTGKKQNNNYHLKSMADSSKIIHQSIDDDSFCVFLLLKGLRSPETIKQQLENRSYLKNCGAACYL